MMIRCLIVLGLVLLTGTCVFAQSRSDSSLSTYPQRSLEFEVDENLRLDGFDDLDIAYRVKTSDTRGWRYGVSLDVNSEEGASESVIIDGPTTSNTQDSSMMSVRLLGQKLFFSQPRHGASFYWGAGPNLSFAKSNAKSESNSHLVSETDMTLWSIGLVADLGVEWRVADQLSLEARYRWFTGYNHSKSETDHYTGDEIQRTNSAESDAFRLEGGNSVDLVVAFHF